MTKPRGNHVETTAPEDFTLWQRARIRHRLWRFYEFSGLRSWKKIADRLRRETNFADLLGMDEYTAVDKAGEPIRRFANDEERTAPERVAAIRDFLIQEGYLSAAELDRHRAPLAPAFAMAEYFDPRAELARGKRSRVEAHRFEAIRPRKPGRIEIRSLELTRHESSDVPAMILAVQETAIYPATDYLDQLLSKSFLQPQHDVEANPLMRRSFYGWAAAPDPERMILYLFDPAPQEHLVLVAIGAGDPMSQDAEGGAVFHLLEQDAIFEEADDSSGAKIEDVVTAEEAVTLSEKIWRFRRVETSPPWRKRKRVTPVPFAWPTTGLQPVE